MRTDTTRLIAQLNPDFRLTQAGEPRHVDSCSESRLRRMRANHGDYLLVLASIEQMQQLYLPPALLDAPDLPHRYATKRFARDLQPIPWRDGEGKLVECPWSTKHSPGRYRELGEGKQPRWESSPPVTAEHLWAKLLLGKFALGVVYEAAEKLPCLLLDLDFSDPAGGRTCSLLEMPAEDRAMLMEQLAGAVRRVEAKLRMKLHPHWMASGGKGCWLHLFFTSPVSRNVLEALANLIRQELPARIGPYLAQADVSNLQNSACRMPLSRHASTRKRAVFLDPVGWLPYEDQLLYVFLIERQVTPGELEERLRGTGVDIAPAVVLHSHTGRGGGGGRAEGRSMEDRPASSQAGDVAEPAPPGWTVAEVGARARIDEGTARCAWPDCLPRVIPEGETQALMIEAGYEARCLAAMIQAGALDPERPWETFPRDEYLAACQDRLQGDPRRTEERMKDLEGRVNTHLAWMAQGWRPHLPPALSREEWEVAETLAQRLLAAKPKDIRRRGNVEDTTEVLRYLAIKTHGNTMSFTQERAVRHLGWVPWDLEEMDPAVLTAKRRLQRVLAWLMEGEEKQAKLGLPPLVRRVKQGYRYAGTTLSVPSQYEVLWQNWGDPFYPRRPALDLEQAA